MISQSFKGSKKNTFEHMHLSAPLPKQQQAMPLCVHADLALGRQQGAGSREQGAGSRDRVPTPWPCAKGHEGLLKAYGLL